jgi:hypothetical protein
MMRLTLGAAVLALCMGMGTAVSAQQSAPMTGGTAMMDSATRPMDWSHRYMLTPLDHKRFEAMGLNDDEVFMVANAARLSGRDPYEIAQMVLRGRAFFQIARELNIPPDRLNDRMPEWETAEWERAVREGWYTHRQGMMSTSGSTAPRR